MPATLEVPSQITAYPPHKLWTRHECEKLEGLGLLDPNGYELIEGELINKMGKKQPHILSLVLLCNSLRSIFGNDFVVPEPSINISPLDNPTSEPQPDAIVLSRAIRDLGASLAGPTDIRLIAEVSDTSLSFDLTTKAALYARAAIPEYWVLDINGRRLIVHRAILQDHYTSVLVYKEDESVSPLASPQSNIRVADLL